MVSNQTVSDVKDRILPARFGSLAPESTVEYLRELLSEVDDWRYHIAEHLREKENEPT